MWVTKRCSFREACPPFKEWSKDAAHVIKLKDIMINLAMTKDTDNMIIQVYECNTVQINGTLHT